MKRSRNLLWRMIIIGSTLLCVVLTCLRFRNANGVDVFESSFHGKYLTFESARDQVAFAVYADYAYVPGLGRNGGPPFFSHEWFADQFANHSDRTINLIAAHFHPWFEPGWGMQTTARWKPFTLVYPWDLNDPKYIAIRQANGSMWDAKGTFGRGIILPAWWAVLFFSLPALGWIGHRAWRKYYPAQSPVGRCFEPVFDGEQSRSKPV